jgi:hypothetical protein
VTVIGDDVDVEPGVADSTSTVTGAEVADRRTVTVTGAEVADVIALTVTVTGADMASE